MLREATQSIEDVLRALPADGRLVQLRRSAGPPLSWTAVFSLGTTQYHFVDVFALDAVRDGVGHLQCYAYRSRRRASQ